MSDRSGANQRIAGALLGARPHGSQNVRIGPVSVFALVVILSMAVLAVLAVASANASLAMTQRQAQAVTETYRDELAAQTFYAALDSALAEARAGETVSAERSVQTSLERALPSAVAQAEKAGNGQVEVGASVEGSHVLATFACEGGRTLTIDLEAQGDGALAVDAWKLTAVTNEEEPMGNLWAGL